MKRYAFFVGLVFCILVFVLLISFAFLLDNRENDDITPEQAVVMSIGALGLISAGSLVVLSDNESERSNWLTKNSLKPGNVFIVAAVLDPHFKNQDYNCYILQNDVAELDRKSYPFKSPDDELKLGDMICKNSQGEIMQIGKAKVFSNS